MNDEIKSYDIPNVDAVSTPDEAGQVLDKIYSDAAANPKHPYTDGHNFQHRKFTEAVQKLHKIKATEIDADGNITERLSPIELACQEGLEIQAEKQSKLVLEAQAEMTKLTELGFEVAEIPENIMPYQLRGLQEQRANAEGDFQSLMPMIEKDLFDLKAFDDLELVRNFKTTTIFDEDFRRDAMNKVIFKIAELNKQKYKGKKQ